MSGADRSKALSEKLAALSPTQLEFIDRIVNQLARPVTYIRNPTSDFITGGVLYGFGDILRIHHCFSVEPFTKDRFEFALEKACNDCQIPVTRATRGNPGHDLTIKGVPFSLKTQADRSIKATHIHISKFMEMGKGDWTDKPEQLKDLRDRFFHHMESYERIVTLRRLPLLGFESYELVEIPKKLLLEAATGELEMMTKSTQFPKPGYCTVKDARGGIKFQLYFDGGTERKLQIKGLDKSLCTVHGTRKFPINEPVAL